MNAFLSEFIHYGTIALAVGINSVGVGIGEGTTSASAIDAINKQPQARGEIVRTAILGMALIETAAILGAVIAIMLLLGAKNTVTPYYVGLAQLGIAFAICLSGLVLGFASALPAKAACNAIARQPFFAQPILRFMLITQSLLQGPIVFGFITATIIQYQAASISTVEDSIRLIASGLCIGLGSIGPSIGLAIFAKNAVQSLGINRRAYPQLFSFTLISQTIIETPIIFAFVVSLSLLLLTPKNLNLLYSIALLAAAICTGLGTFGPGVSSGKTASAACKQIAYHPEQSNTLSRVSMFAQGMIETCAIYAVLVSFVLIFVIH